MATKQVPALIAKAVEIRRTKKRKSWFDMLPAKTQSEIREAVAHYERGGEFTLVDLAEAIRKRYKIVKSREAMRVFLTSLLPNK